jgi:hypothetical protein
MVKMKNRLELEDSQISKLNEFFLIADRIRKAGRSSRLGVGKLKSKLNPNGGGARPSVSTSGGNTSSANDPLSSASLHVQSSQETPLKSSDFLSRKSLGKEGKKEFRASEVPAAPSNLARCQASGRIAQAISERSDRGAHEGNQQRPPLEITLTDIAEQIATDAIETTIRSPPTRVSSSPSSLPPRLSESFFVFAGKDVDMEQDTRDAIAARLAKGKEEAAKRGMDAS